MYLNKLSPKGMALYNSAPTAVKNVVWAMLEIDFLAGLEQGDYDAQYNVETCLECLTQSEALTKAQRLNSGLWLSHYRSNKNWAALVNSTMNAMVVEIVKEQRTFQNKI